jgi:hypothetical protein
MTQGSESVVVPRAVDDALKALRSVSSSVSEDADEMGASLTCLAAADALQRLWSEVVTTWRASAFPRDAEHAGELADTMDQLLGSPLAAAPSTSVREEELASHARFLVDRIREFEGTLSDPQEAERDFYGHVAPAIARLEAALVPSPDEGKRHG